MSMPWTKFDEGFYMHPKAVRAGDEALGAFLRMCCYANHHLTDGRISHAQARALAIPQRNLERLLGAGLLEAADDEFLIHDFLDYNPSRATVIARRKAQREGGRKGAASRWHGSSNGLDHD